MDTLDGLLEEILSAGQWAARVDRKPDSYYRATIFRDGLTFSGYGPTATRALYQAAKVVVFNGVTALNRTADEAIGAAGHPAAIVAEAEAE